MTKAEIKAIAEDVKMMDILNTISGLMEKNNSSDNELINSLTDDLYKKINSIEHSTREKPTKNQMLHYIMDNYPDVYQKIKYQRFPEVRFWYLKLTKGE